MVPHFTEYVQKQMQIFGKTKYRENNNNVGYFYNNNTLIFHFDFYQTLNVYTFINFDIIT